MIYQHRMIDPELVIMLPLRNLTENVGEYLIIWSWRGCFMVRVKKLSIREVFSILIRRYMGETGIVEPVVLLMAF